MSWLIEGVTDEGRTFRPSDWVDRVSGAVASFGRDHRLRYGAVRPCFVGGKKCLTMKKTLQDENPAAFDFVQSFVRTNGLRMSDLSAVKASAEMQEQALDAVA